MLGYAEIGAIDNMRRDHVAQRSHRLRPGGIQSPVRELFDILDQHHFRPVELGGRYDSPGCRPGRIVLRVARLFAACLRVTLAAWRSQHDVVGRDLRPVRLV
ncbi:hypothetical protein D3C85_1206380 [compost metagenome]